jgi:F-type H+-transporting ATPase subunit delta
MAELATIARPYANAVFKLAKGEGALDRWSRMLGILAATAEHPVVERMLGSPDLPGTAKAFKLAEVCGDELDDRGKKFLQALAANDRLPLLEEISEQFEALKAEEQSSLDVEVVSAYPLSESESEKLKTALSGRFAKEIAIASRVDPELIGGVVIRAGDMVIDGSLRGRLNKLAETLGQH